MITYPLPRVRAHLAYFQEMRKAARGTPEFNDLDTTVNLIEQLVYVMEQQQPKKEKKSTPAPEEKP
jgi:hypothetical protein